MKVGQQESSVKNSDFFSPILCAIIHYLSEASHTYLTYMLKYFMRM